MAPTVASLVDKLIVHVLGPVCEIVPVFVQLEDQPPNLTPVCAGAVSVTVVGSPLVNNGYVAVQTDLPTPAPGPQVMTALQVEGIFGLHVAEGAVISQFVVFSPSL